VRSAFVHALFWLALMNAMGVMLSVLLMAPADNHLLGEWTYGRWMMVHMNLGLYGWCGLPMLGLLFEAYGVAESRVQRWARPVVWLWSASLVVGSVSWFNGETSGKLFLDWAGTARIFFPLSMQALWLLLVLAFVEGVRARRWTGWLPIAVRGVPLLLLVVVPAAIYVTASAALYPHFNPDTGGPTGASQLESSLAVVAILLLLPLAVVKLRQGAAKGFALAWGVLAVEGVLCALMNHADSSHRDPVQYLGLALMLPWIILLPRVYAGFAWHEGTDAWRRAFLAWWMGLVLTGWIVFLPGVLDRLKFTDGLVGHSLTAIAGCLSAFLVLVMQQMLGPDQQIFRSRWAFMAWNHSVLLYVVLMFVAGWIEGGNPGFTIVPGVGRNLIYGLRVLSGLGMFAASMEWLLAAWRTSAEGLVRKSMFTATKEVA
jgi:cytochrome c oxidase cbb3-type subunit 1